MAATTRTRAHFAVDIVIECEEWSTVPDAESTIRRAIEAAGVIQRETGSIAVMLTDDVAIKALNARWRGIDLPTNVLSFPAGEMGLKAADAYLGDIAIAYETVAREAEAENKAFLDHLAHLAIHGYLHLLGFDHDTDSEAEQMEGLETRILSGLGIADPYALQNCGD